MNTFFHKLNSNTFLLTKWFYSNWMSEPLIYNAIVAKLSFKDKKLPAHLPKHLSFIRKK